MAWAFFAILIPAVRSNLSLRVCEAISQCQDFLSHQGYSENHLPFWNGN
ncbi:hypothetical protein FLJC2902T_19510 [Flavobacterium limnosediminis JC2902]|uniref:Uncharacterized protein n=1 Tax=Flavobacterium limnosediminis JC2902 TaxID=1341181 RepID=V6SN30_9FLAO|nr:hypothetical protein FLJC2902T_19510 [Flavobacterium limnosediminis JC2902]